MANPYQRLSARGARTQSAPRPPRQQTREAAEADPRGDWPLPRRTSGAYGDKGRQVGRDVCLERTHYLGGEEPSAPERRQIPSAIGSSSEARRTPSAPRGCGRGRNLPSGYQAPLAARWSTLVALWHCECEPAKTRVCQEPPSGRRMLSSNEGRI